MTKLKRICVVYADWCPHCVPTTVEPVKRKAEQIGVHCTLYDVDDPNASEKADELVKKCGDWSEDYLVPQVFLEYEGGEVKHVFTGYSESIELTRSGLIHLLESRLLNQNSWLDDINGS